MANKFAEMALAISRLTKNADLKAAVDQAITGSVSTLALKKETDSEAKSLWSAWNKAANIAAADGFTASDMSNLLDMRIAELTDGDEGKAKALATYKSRTSTLVPILALPDADYAQLWAEAHIMRGDEPAPVSREFNTQDATKLIRAAKGKDNAEQAAFEAAFKRLSKLIRDQAKPGDLEGLKAEEKAEARKAAFRSATLLCDELFTYAMNGEEAPGEGGGELDDDAIHALVEQHDADEAIDQQAAAL